VTTREKETRAMLREAATRLPHGYAYAAGKRCPGETCFRCHIERFLRVRVAAGDTEGTP
jgi:hypothetical protein